MVVVRYLLFDNRKWWRLLGAAGALQKGGAARFATIESNNMRWVDNERRCNLFGCDVSRRQSFLSLKLGRCQHNMSSLCQHWPPAIECCISKRTFRASFEQQRNSFINFSIYMLKTKIMISPAFVYFSTRNERNGGENPADNAQKRFTIPTNKGSRLLAIFNDG